MRDSNGMHREPFTFTRTVLNGIEMVRGLYIREVFDTLYGRLRMTIRRSKEITLKIINA